MFSYTNLQTENVKKCTEEAMDSQGEQKNYTKEDQERAVKELISGNVSNGVD